jgi:hypothetical protein
VVPAVATTAITGVPARARLSRLASRASASRRPSWSTGTYRRARSGRPARGGIEVGQGPRMVGVVSTLHDQLQIGQQALGPKTAGLGFHLRKHAQAG